MPVEYPYHPCKVYLPTFGLFFMVHVGKCAIHGLFGIGKSFHKIQISEAYKSIDVVVPFYRCMPAIHFWLEGHWRVQLADRIKTRET